MPEINQEDSPLHRIWRRLWPWSGWIVAVLLLLLSHSTADAKPLKKGNAHATRAHHHRTIHRPARPMRLPTIVVRSDDRADGWSLFTPRSSLVAAARSQIGNGAVYGRARLWCARFVNYVLRSTGHTGTGSDRAASFARYGRKVSGPRVGAIAVMRRRGGGHVGVVSGVDDRGNPVVISGNHNGRVAEAVYPASRVYAYVVPN